MRYEPRSTSRFSIGKNQILLAIVAVAVLMAVVAGFEEGQFDWRGLAGNLSTELIGAVITYFIIDRIINQQEQEQQLKERLIREMGNRNNAVSSRAVDELRERGWLSDGSLSGWFLSDADLQGLYLRDANVAGMGLYRSNLKEARISDEQLMTLNDLRRTIMPDGTRYDGRFCLNGDLKWALSKYDTDPTTATAAAMAAYYEVDEALYLDGQRWAIEHIPERVPNRTIIETSRSA